MNAGVINLSVDFGDSYSEELEKNNINVVELTMENFEQMIPDLDAVIIRENAIKDTAQTCSILIELKEKSDAYVWVFSSSAQKILRRVYLQLGALGLIHEDCDESELQLIVSNSLDKKKKLAARGLSHSFEINNMELVEEDDSERIKLIPRNHGVIIQGREEIPLTRLEYRTMELLHAHKNETVTYKEMYEQVWRKEFKDQNYRVANLIFHLREKIEHDSVKPAIIRTVRSRGYMLID